MAVEGPWPVVSLERYCCLSQRSFPPKLLALASWRHLAQGEDPAPESDHLAPLPHSFLGQHLPRGLKKVGL